MDYIKQHEGIPFKNVKDPGFASYVLEKVQILAKKYNTLNITLDSLPDLPRHPQRKEILREISEKLTEYYGEKVDAISWFLVLYHGNDVFERHTYRDIEGLLKEMNITHTGKNGAPSYYNSTSIRKTLSTLGWDSYERTEHTTSGTRVKSLKKSIRSKDAVSQILESLQKELPVDASILKKDINISNAQYAKELLAYICTHYPKINDYGRRVQSNVLNLLVGEDIFTPDSLR